MVTSNPLDILLAHNAWATRKIMDACVPLSVEQFHRRFEMGPGSLHDTLTHILAAMRVWTDVLCAQEIRPRIDGDGVQRTPQQLLTLLDEYSAELSAIAGKHPVDELVTRVRDGKTYTFPRGGVLTHVTTHGMHHRAQCLNMLRHVGVSPLPASSVVEWMIAGSPPR